MTFKVDDCIFFQLAKASQAGSKYWASFLAGTDVTAIQGMVINFLGEEDSITSSELGRRTGMDSATLTGILDRLENAGLIERQRHPEDRRAILVCLTEKGRCIAGKVFQLSERANEKFLSDFSSKEKATLRSLLRKVRGLV